ncbi:hypothetical protein SAMN05445060_3818 [Williamsia sterculiae]|uniref:Uncharacterized protein n=2 Tax=Williamsia sterculiae TaxID=1344003 RepID=A0A1N7H9Y9_9NOCA|nr:hypothetical protein SAMN05445060_3818 [Williamsia sterculiae]
MRSGWVALAFITLVVTIGAGLSDVSHISLSCSKTGRFNDRGAADGVSCSDSIVSVVGVGHLVALAVLLVLPPLPAAFTRRNGVGWLVVVGYIVVAVAGLTQWSGFWGLLLLAAPLAIVATVIALTEWLTSL